MSNAAEIPKPVSRRKNPATGMIAAVFAVILLLSVAVLGRFGFQEPVKTHGLWLLVLIGISALISCIAGWFSIGTHRGKFGAFTGTAFMILVLTGWLLVSI